MIGIHNVLTRIIFFFPEIPCASNNDETTAVQETHCFLTRLFYDLKSLKLFQSKVLLIVVTAEHCKIVANWSRSVAKIVVRFASLEKLVK